MDICPKPPTPNMQGATDSRLPAPPPHTHTNTLQVATASSHTLEALRQQLPQAQQELLKLQQRQADVGEQVRAGAECGIRGPVWCQ